MEGNVKTTFDFRKRWIKPLDFIYMLTKNSSSDFGKERNKATGKVTCELLK